MEKYREMAKDLSLEMMEASLHKLMSMDFSDCIGTTKEDGYQAFYHEMGLYSVKHIDSGIICLVYAHDAYEAIEIVETYRGER